MREGEWNWASVLEKTDGAFLTLMVAVFTFSPDEWDWLGIR